MPHSTRTFVAVELSDSARGRIARIIEQLSPKAPGVRWIRPENIHLTLAFLGDVPDPDLPGLCKLVEEAVGSLTPFKLDIKGFGSFPPQGRPRVIWVGLEGDLEPLKQLQKAVVEASRTAGYPPTDNRFNPHITLGRVKAPSGPPLDVQAITKPFALWSAGVLEVRQVVTFASLLRSEGPEYRALSRARLSG